jgi:hypothetical protein
METSLFKHDLIFADASAAKIKRLLIKAALKKFSYEEILLIIFL